MIPGLTWGKCRCPDPCGPTADLSLYLPANGWNGAGGASSMTLFPSTGFRTQAPLGGSLLDVERGSSGAPWATPGPRPGGRLWPGPPPP
ncbi:MAG: hypothetical protein CM15mP79_2100 [Methanobacteriota archaeon]|nr:MAG: hypothetical protein CM15mP79_2100 [Euryarchaeota archaeon]